MRYDISRYTPIERIFRCTTDAIHDTQALHRREEFARSRGFRYGRGRGGPRARRGDVRAAVLALLAERPMHGYEMIEEIEERTEGAWTPSAGSIYPTPQLLEDEGLISGQESEGKRRGGPRPGGRAPPNRPRRPARRPPWDAVRADAAPEQTSLARLDEEIFITRFARPSPQPTQARKWVRELLDQTRRKIYAILAEEG